VRTVNSSKPSERRGGNGIPPENARNDDVNVRRTPQFCPGRGSSRQQKCSGPIMEFGCAPAICRRHNRRERLGFRQRVTVFGSQEERGREGKPSNQGRRPASETVIPWTLKAGGFCVKVILLRWGGGWVWGWVGGWGGVGVGNVNLGFTRLLLRHHRALCGTDAVSCGNCSL